MQLTLNVEIGYLHLMSTFTNFIPKNKVSEKVQSELRDRQRLSRVILNVGTVFVQSDATASIFFHYSLLRGYYLRLAFISLKASNCVAIQGNYSISTTTRADIGHYIGGGTRGAPGARAPPFKLSGTMTFDHTLSLEHMQ